MINRDIKDDDDVNEEVVTPTYLYDALRSHGFEFTNGYEQDAHELFQGLLDALSEKTGTGADPMRLSEGKTEETNPLILSKFGSNSTTKSVCSPTEEQSPFIGTDWVALEGKALNY